jgi:hypothetical protein
MMRQTLPGAFPDGPLAATRVLAQAATDSRWRAALAELERALADQDMASAIYKEAEAAFQGGRPRRPKASAFLKHDTAETYNARLRLEIASHERADAEYLEHSGFRKIEEAFTRASEVAGTALMTVLATPAPDLAAVVHKIELAREDGLELSDLDPVLADLRRLGAL